MTHTTLQHLKEQPTTAHYTTIHRLLHTPLNEENYRKELSLELFGVIN